MKPLLLPLILLAVACGPSIPSDDLSDMSEMGDDPEEESQSESPDSDLPANPDCEADGDCADGICADGTCQACDPTEDRYCVSGCGAVDPLQVPGEVTLGICPIPCHDSCPAAGKGDASCVTINTAEYCVSTCTTDSDCLPGNHCVETDGTAFCANRILAE